LVESSIRDGSPQGLDENLDVDPQTMPSVRITSPGGSLLGSRRALRDPPILIRMTLPNFPIVTIATQAADLRYRLGY